MDISFANDFISIHHMHWESFFSYINLHLLNQTYPFNSYSIKIALQ